VTDGRGVLSASRRRARKGDLKEQAILATCERLLGEKPLGEIGVDELAAGAGISRPTFYFYFESKNAVLRALVERLAEQMYAEAASWLARDLRELHASRSSVTGPSLTSETLMCAPNSPPCAPRAERTRS
jgi:AcrR family transcriptional regulator